MNSYPTFLFHDYRENIELNESSISYEKGNIYSSNDILPYHDSFLSPLDEEENQEHIYFINKYDDSNHIINEKKDSEKKNENENAHTTVKTPETQNQIQEMNNTLQNPNLETKKSKIKEKKEEIDYIGKKQGRRCVKENEKNEEETEGHNKFSEDNIMRKIKTNVMDMIFNQLDESLTDKRYTFLKIDKEVSEILKKEYNLALMDRTILDIIINEPIRSKYKRNDYDNKFLVKKIMEEKKEEETIKILNKTYYDIIVEIREEKLEYFLDKIIKKEKNMKKKSNIEVYIPLLKEKLFTYKEWFMNKKGRNRIKK